MPRLTGTLLQPGRRLAIFTYGHRLLLREPRQSLNGARIEDVAAGHVGLRHGASLITVAITSDPPKGGAAASAAATLCETPMPHPADGAHKE